MKLGHAFGMVRTSIGYRVKSTMLFVLLENEKDNARYVSKFAKEFDLELAEVWERDTEKWDKVIPYKVYHFLPTLHSNISERFER